MLNISNHNKAVIWLNEFMQTLKNRSFFYDLIKTVRCITRLMPNYSEIDVYDSFYPMYWRAAGGMLFTKIFFNYYQKGKLY